MVETIQHVRFDRDVRVQVFEVTIRMLGGLVSRRCSPNAQLANADPALLHSYPATYLPPILHNEATLYRGTMASS